MDDAELFFDQRHAERFSRSELTMLDDKAVAYSTEASYRETLYELARRFSSLNDLACTLRRTGIGLFRPDAIAHNKAADALSYLERIGIRPVHVQRIEVTPHAVRDIWRYQLNTASGQRLRLLDLLFKASPSLCVLFNADPSTPGLPCTVLMADCKGPADVKERQGWELRAFLQSPNRVEVYIHCCDEPADVVRDGGLLVGPVAFAQAIVHRHDPHAANTIRILVQELANDARYGSQVDVDPLFRGSLGRGDAPTHWDRWKLLREVADNCVMVTGASQTLIPDSGVCRWWKEAGLLGDRQRYLAERTGWTGGEITAPLP